jgi:hypothetical protein
VTSDTEIHNWEASAQGLSKNLHDLDLDLEEEQHTPCSIKECFEIAEKLKMFATYHGKSSILEFWTH